MWQMQAQVSEDRSVLEARLLGGCDLRYQERQIPVSAFKRRRSLTLLLLLLSSPDHRITRGQALETLWPEKPSGESEGGLRVVLADLRAGLGERAADIPVISQEGFLALNPRLQVEIDAEVFESTATSALAQRDLGALRRAAGLYTGAYLPDHPYDDWALARREHLSQIHKRVLAQLVGLEQHDDPSAAEGRLRALLVLDPTNEGAARRLMKLLARQDRRAEAARVYHALVTALQDELEMAPSAATEQVRIDLFGEKTLPAASMAPPNADSARTNLPAPSTSFVGREWELAEVKGLLLQPPSGCRLLTLTGTGGCGKTRLALEVGKAMLSHYADGVWFVDLAPLTDPALLPQTIADALGVRQVTQAEQSGGTALIDLLRHKQSLVLLDNCEHLIGAAAELAATMLHSCPQLHLLATSREALAITGEVTWRVPPLSLPPETGHAWAPDVRNRAISAESLARYGAVRLFVERARTNRPGFSLTDHNAATVATICRRLDGIPLALELAAAQLRTLPLTEITARLDDRFRLLETDDRAAIPRHRTLRAVMDWSYSLLAAAERVLLQRLSIFAGGWTLDAAEGICADGDVPEGEMVEHLFHLVDKSLVAVDDAGDQETDAPTRYHMLELVRRYARDRLHEADEATIVPERHAAWYLARAEETEPALAGAGQIEALRRLEADHDNLRVALQWSLADPARAEIAVRYVLALWRFWEIRGHWAEARRWLTEALMLRHLVSPRRQCDLLGAAGTLAFNQGEFDRAAPLFGAVLALERQLGDQAGIAFALHKLARTRLYGGEFDQAVALFEESLALKRTLGDRKGMAATLNSLGVTATGREQFDEALGWLRESQTIWRELGDMLYLAYTLNNVGIVLRHQGNLVGAAAHFEESLALFRQLGEQWGIAATRHNLGALARQRGEHARAAALYRESLLLWRDLGDKRSIATSLEEWAELAGATGMPARAAQLFGAAAALRAAIGAPQMPSDRTVHAPLLAVLGTALGEVPFARLWSEGQQMPTEQAIALATTELPAVTGSVAVPS